MADGIRVKLRKPFPKQNAFIRSPAKRKVVRAGRRGGKTTGVATLAMIKFLLGRRQLYATPTADQADRFWYECIRALGDAIKSRALIKNETRRTITVPGTETRIKVKTAWNADTLRGDYADDLYLDEFQLINEDAWEVVGAPMMLDNNGDAVFIYTPPSLHSKSTSKARDPLHAAKLFKRASEDTTGLWETFHFSSWDNPFLSQQALEIIQSDMSALAIRQELYALDLEEIPGALWTMATIERNRVSKAPDHLDEVGVGVDPAGSKTGHEIGIIVGGVARGPIRPEGYMLADYSMNGTPEAWAKKVINAYDEWEADFVAVETNYGGEMVASTIQLVAQAMGHGYINIREVRATRGKAVRAEPVAGLDEHGTIHHVGQFPILEDQMCSFLIGQSDDRVDARVWIFTELLVHNYGMVSF